MWGELALRAQADYFAHLAGAASTEARRHNGLLAVLTGVWSNTHNGVTGDADANTVSELVAWFDERDAPAVWIFPEAEPAPAVAAGLVAAGARPERSGIDMGARIADVDLEPPPPPGVEVEPVEDERALEEWLDVAGSCGWFDHERDRAARRRLYLELGLDPRGRFRHFLARRGDRAVGMASAFLAGDTFVQADLAVLEDERRRGVGRALALARLRQAREAGYETAIVAPSPDAVHLYRSLGFTVEPTPPDRLFYLPLTPKPA